MKLKHKAIDTIVKALMSSNRKNKNLWIYGESGLGKSVIAECVADKLGLDFYTMSLSAQTTTNKLVGFLDANSNYKPTPLRKAYENGGLICLEECDTVNAGVLAEINNLLSQDIYSFPDETINKHPDFKLVCCANSNGRNTDLKYIKSQNMDASTMDRYVYIKVDLDKDLAKALTDNEDWYNRVMKFREIIPTVCDNEIVVGMRAMLDGADLLENGFSQSEVEDMVIYKGIDEDIIDAIKAKMDIKSEQVSSRQIPSYVKNTDGIYILTNDNGEESAWLDKEYIDKQDPKLLEIIKSGLGLH